MTRSIWRTNRRSTSRAGGAARTTRAFPIEYWQREAHGMSGKIYVGIGGWTFEPWRGVFYPKGLPQKRELEYAGQHLTSIEINGTYYSTFKPRKLGEMARRDARRLVFSVKASRYCTNRRELAERGRIDRALYRSGDERAARPARPDQLAIHGHQEVRCRGFRGVPEIVAARGDRLAVAPCARAQEPELSKSRILRSRAHATMSRSALPTARISR